MDDIKVYNCKRCDRKTVMRKNKETGEYKLPKYCGKCHSPYWNKKRVYKMREAIA